MVRIGLLYRIREKKNNKIKNRKKRIMHLGNLNCPFAEPSPAIELSTLPFTSNIWTRWLLESETMTRFVLETAI